MDLDLQNVRCQLSTQVVTGSFKPLHAQVLLTALSGLIIGGFFIQYVYVDPFLLRRNLFEEHAPTAVQHECFIWSHSVVGLILERPWHPKKLLSNSLLSSLSSREKGGQRRRVVPGGIQLPLVLPWIFASAREPSKSRTMWFHSFQNQSHHPETFVSGILYGLNCWTCPAWS